MKNLNELMSLLVITAVSAVLISMTYSQQEPAAPWEVPVEYKNMENPEEANEASLKAGKMQYTKHCAFCHGRTGKGDGVKARTLETFSVDFSGDLYQNQTDGEHFYKTKFGRGEMPAYEDKISDEDIWRMVNYMRTFAE